MGIWGMWKRGGGKADMWEYAQKELQAGQPVCLATLTQHDRAPLTDHVLVVLSGGDRILADICGSFGDGTMDAFARRYGRETLLEQEDAIYQCMVPDGRYEGIAAMFCQYLPATEESLALMAQLLEARVSGEETWLVRHVNGKDGYLLRPVTTLVMQKDGEIPKSGPSKTVRKRLLSAQPVYLFGWSSIPIPAQET